MGPLGVTFPDNALICYPSAESESIYIPIIFAVSHHHIFGKGIVSYGHNIAAGDVHIQ